MNILLKKPLFWTNIIAFIFAGWLIAGLAFGWTNPGVSPPGGGGAIGAGANAPINSLYVDSAGRIGVGKTNPYQNAKIDVNGSIALVGQRVFDLSGGALTIGDIDSGDGAISGIQFRTNDTTRATIDGSGTLDLNGRLRLRAGAAMGRVLISDASGNATWQPPTWIGAGGLNVSCPSGYYLQGILNGLAQRLTLPAAPAPSGPTPYSITRTFNSTGGVGTYAGPSYAAFPGLRYLFSVPTGATERVSVTVSFGYYTGTGIYGQATYFSYLYDGGTLVGSAWPDTSGAPNWRFNLGAGNHDLTLYVQTRFSGVISSASMTVTRVYP